MIHRYMWPQIAGGGQRELGPAGDQRSFKEQELEFIFSFVFYVVRRNNVISSESHRTKRAITTSKSTELMSWTLTVISHF